MKLSVIIPVYNSLPTLVRCVDSVVVQPVDDLEIILVDDGSTDGSGAMCDNLKRQYEGEGCEIKVVHKANGGLSSARNAGLAVCTGDLLTFVDSDDYVGKNTYGELMDIFERDETIDVLEFPVAKFYNDFLKKEFLDFACKAYDQAVDYLFDTEAFRHAYACNKVYRKNRIAIEYPMGKTFEDLATLPQWLSQARKIVTADKGCYYYTLNPRGICNTAGERQFKDHIEALQNLISWIPKEHAHGAEYAKLVAQMLNVRRDYEKCRTTLGSPESKINDTVNIAISWSDIFQGLRRGMRKPEILKLIIYKLKI